MPKATKRQLDDALDEWHLGYGGGGGVYYRLHSIAGPGEDGEYLVVLIRDDL